MQETGLGRRGFTNLPSDPEIRDRLCNTTSFGQRSATTTWYRPGPSRVIINIRTEPSDRFERKWIFYNVNGVGLFAYRRGYGSVAGWLAGEISASIPDSNVDLGLSGIVITGSVMTGSCRSAWVARSLARHLYGLPNLYTELIQISAGFTIC